jgi:hypothetical protein
MATIFKQFVDAKENASKRADITNECMASRGRQNLNHN